MRAKQLLIFAILLIGLTTIATPHNAHGSIIRVPLDMPTIQAAIDSANPGDTVSVSPGTYLEHLLVNRPSISLVGTSRDTTVIDGQGTGTVVWVNASNVEIRGLTVRNPDFNGWAVHVEHSSNVNITSNSISTNPVNGDGLNLYSVSNVIVDMNVFSENLYAVNATSSQHLQITNNQAVANDTIGVQLKESSNCQVFNNSFVGGEDGVDILQSSFNNTVTRNLVKGMSLDGIALQPDSSLSPPSQFPQNNTVNENTFERNHIGVNLQNATMNTFYHNDFFQSSYRHVNPVENSATFFVQVSPNYWDNSSLGGLVGGNYWDNYTGADGNHDGIGDTPYFIGRGNQDNYPLMAPFGPEPVLIESITPTPRTGAAPLSVSFSVTVVGTLTPFSYSWNFGDGTASSSLASPNHVFTRPGNYTVSLTVRDSSGTTDTRSANVVVGVSGPISYLVWVIIGGIAGVLVALVVVRRRRMKKNQRAKDR